MANVVLVHGLWVDGSSWRLVMRELMDRGHHVTAAQLPLTSLSDDVAAVRRVLAQQDGPVVLVGHSYGGAVISAASHGAHAVSALVFVAAVATGRGEAAETVLGRFAPSEGLGALVADAEGYLTMDRDRFPALFAGDVPAREAQVMAACQVPAAGACLAEPAGGAGWHERPSWYVLCTQDRTVTPQAQQAIADRIGATVITAEASHAVAIARPAAVVEAIECAALTWV
ncbi:alpha/beta fold hydrolase [Streptomyces sp. NPDC101151]|uniref:alpha/beta fold hydrolase n=1 Tax=Streptomyces sp. NPDC101151 TaxID=3366115 RepID=UPI0038215EB3